MGNIDKFDTIANRYDTEDRIKVARIISEAIRERIVNGREKSAIDYGCGTGLVGMNLLDTFGSILFVDASSKMIAQVEEKISRLNQKTLEARCIDLVMESPSDLHSDYIIMAQTLLHIPEVELILAHLYAILKKGGHLLIIDFDKNNDIISAQVQNGFEQEELKKVIKRIGFIKAESNTFYHGENLFMNKKASLFLLDAEK